MRTASTYRLFFVVFVMVKFERIPLENGLRGVFPIWISGKQMAEGSSCKMIDVIHIY